MKVAYYLIIVGVLLLIFACENPQEIVEEPEDIKPAEPISIIDFDTYTLKKTIWYGTGASDGHLIYMRLDTNRFYLLEVDTAQLEYIETVSTLQFKLTSSDCLIANYFFDLGPDTGGGFPLQHFLNNYKEDFILHHITLSKLSEYEAVKRRYFPLHFRNFIVGELNLSTLQEIVFKDTLGQVVLNVQRDTSFTKQELKIPSNYKRKYIEYEHSFKTDSSQITYYITGSTNGKHRSSFFRERLKGEKEDKWRGKVIATYKRDFLIIEYKLVDDEEQMRPSFIKIMKMDSALYQYPIEGRY
ncbi:hypothetical protein [Aureispira sp. CCB-QB1]|uniref:hypothetical protein n=1 Tax=Aureispira sp. CCB-QB1 TaxID=1313421 RepID=UPI000695C62D|nr:hypothetical protein [Aureispira sp. CCB-QB1]